MRNILLCTLAGILILGVAACEEEKGPAFVSGGGTMSPPGGSASASFEGKLSPASSTAVYGYCSYQNGEFEFEVGDSSLGQIDEIPGGFYFRFRGIKGAGDGGAPIVGVLDEDGNMKIGPEYYSKAGLATVASSDTFSFESADVCNVELFATPAPGELIPDLNKEFQYFVQISCNGITDVSGGNSGVALENVFFKAYFDNC